MVNTYSDATRFLEEARASGLELDTVPANAGKIRLLLDLCREIPASGTLKVLDVGCGGRNSPLNLWEPFVPLADRLTMSGVDIAFLDETRARASELGFDMDLKHASVFDIERIYGAAAFNAVVSTQMLEHIQDWRGAIRHMAGVLKPGGVLLLTCDSGDVGHPALKRIRLQGKRIYAQSAERMPVLGRVGNRFVSGEWEQGPRGEDLRTAATESGLTVERLEHYALRDLKDAKGGPASRLLGLAFEETLQRERREPFDQSRYLVLYLRARR